MGYQELISALRRDADDKAEALWREARDEAEKARNEAVARFERIREECAGRQAAAVREASRRILAAAENKARRGRLDMFGGLSARLYRLAAASLVQLRERQYEELFAALAQELPPHSWEVVRINPADREMASRYFPEAKIVPDAGISGGMEVVGKDERIRIVNTLEKRLERCWPELLPDLVRAVCGEVGRNAFA
jgi:V/A-type H+-transporting ATPase subunit E